MLKDAPAAKATSTVKADHKGYVIADTLSECRRILFGSWCIQGMGECEHAECTERLLFSLMATQHTIVLKLI